MIPASNAARVALALIELAPDSDGEQVTVGRPDLNAYWLERYLHQAGDLNKKLRRQRALKKISLGLVRLESLGMAQRVSNNVVGQSVLLLDTRGLRDLVVRSEWRDSTTGKAACPFSGEVAFETERAALLELLSAWQKFSHRKTRCREQRSYQCDLCRRWHLAPGPQVPVLQEQA